MPHPETEAPPDHQTDAGPDTTGDYKVDVLGEAKAAEESGSEQKSNLPDDRRSMYPALWVVCALACAPANIASKETACSAPGFSTPASLFTSV